MAMTGTQARAVNDMPCHADVLLGLANEGPPG